MYKQISIILSLLILSLPNLSFADSEQHQLAVDYDFPDNQEVHIIRSGTGMFVNDLDIMKYNGIGWVKNSDNLPYTKTKIIVRNRKNPFILVLLSQGLVEWEIEKDKDSNISAIVTGGVHWGKVSGIDKDIPILQTKLFSTSPDSRRYDRSNLLSEKEIIETVEVITGNDIKSFQSASILEKAYLTELTDKPLNKNSELHAISIYHGNYNKNGSAKKSKYVDIATAHKVERVRMLSEVDIEIPESKKPIVLSLDAHEPVKWNISKSEHTDIKAIILSGNFPQNVTGVEDNTRIILRNFRMNTGKDKPENRYTDRAIDFDSIKGHLKYATGLGVNTYVENLEKITGLEVKNIYYRYTGDKFIISGENEVKTYSSFHDINSISLQKNTEIHAIGLYEGKNPVGVSSSGGAPSRPQFSIDRNIYLGDEVTVELQKNPNPVFLMLSSFSYSNWKINNPDNVKIAGRMYGGRIYQEFSGLSNEVPIYYKSGLINSYKSRNEMDIATKELFKKKLTSYQGKYRAKDGGYSIPPRKQESKPVRSIKERFAAMKLQRSRKLKKPVKARIPVKNIAIPETRSKPLKIPRPTLKPVKKANNNSGNKLATPRLQSYIDTQISAKPKSQPFDISIKGHKEYESKQPNDRKL